MSVVARFYVAETARTAGTPDAVNVTLRAVGHNGENTSWADATPSGTLTMSIQNPDAAVEFWPGREFSILLAPITDDRPATHQTVRRTTLADCAEYVPSDYERDNPGRGSHRCAQCGCRAQSHVEPLRSKVIRVLGLAPGFGPGAADEARPTGTDA